MHPTHVEKDDVALKSIIKIIKFDEFIKCTEAVIRNSFKQRNT